jgi:hypothetical protein
MLIETFEVVLIQHLLEQHTEIQKEKKNKKYNLIEYNSIHLLYN